MHDAYMPLTVVGCDFRCAPSQYRSRLVLEGEQALLLFEMLKKDRVADGFVDLNTCNRNEWIVSGPDPQWAAELLKAQMIDRVGEQAVDWLKPYVYTGEQAARHVFRVAIGQESLVVGERQIAGQLHQALEKARDRQTSSRVLNGLGTVAGRLVRIALRRGCIESAAVGVHALAVSYLEHVIAKDTKIRVAVVGLGKIGRRVLGLLEEKQNMEVVCCNRTVKKNQALSVLPLDRLSEVLQQVDAAVVCTGALTPVVSRKHLADRALIDPLILVDVGIPEQIDRACRSDHVKLVGLDDLTGFYREKTCSCIRSEQMCDEAERLVERALEEYEAFCRERPFSNVLDIVQKNHRQLVGEEIPRLISTTLGYLPHDDRARLETDLKNIVLGYTSEVFHTIKEAARRNGEEQENE